MMEREGTIMAKEKVYKLNTATVEEPAEQEPVKSGRRHMGVWIAVLLILVIGIAGGIFLYIYTKRTYDDYEVLSQTASTDATQMSYVAYNGSLIKYSKEGISYLDKEGNALWMESYKMKQPMVVVSGEYVAAADMNGNAVYIFNKDGKVSSLETPYTISNLDVASQGVVAVVLENETENYIELYDKFGASLVEIRTTIADSGYPMDIALSEDGSKLVTSYITIDGVTVKNSIAAYNFDDVGQNATDRLVGGFNNLGDTIIPKVEFLDNDTVCAFGDDQFVIYSMKEKPSEKSVITDFRGEVQSIFYNSRYIGIIEKNQGDGDSLYQMRVFDTNGNQRFSEPIEFGYRNIYATEDEIFVIGASESRIYDFQGNMKFACGFSREVENIVPTGSLHKYIVVYDEGTEVIKLKRAEEEEETETTESTTKEQQAEP